MKRQGATDLLIFRRPGWQTFVALALLALVLTAAWFVTKKWSAAVEAARTEFETT